MAKKTGQKQLKKILQAQGIYSPVFDVLIENCVKLIHVSDMAYQELEVSGPITAEMSREGEVRRKVHPAVSVFLEASKELRANLVELSMTVKSSTLSSADELDEITQKLNNLGKK